MDYLCCLIQQLYISFSLCRYIFPGLGLGVTVAGCKTVTDRMLYVAAEALANFVTPVELEQGKVFPHIGNIRAVSHRVAVAVAEEAIREGQAKKIGPEQKVNLPDLMARKMYYPEYVPLVEKREITI
jgi:malate dehydrogenase (oxaloacetate-decarboxylating)(NADP+)